MPGNSGVEGALLSALWLIAHQFSTSPSCLTLNVLRREETYRLGFVLERYAVLLTSRGLSALSDLSRLDISLQRVADCRIARSVEGYHGLLMDTDN